jgi:hypothetical protein
MFISAQLFSIPHVTVKREADPEESQGGVMKSQSSRAEETAAFLLQAEGNRLPVMIPGALQRRASASAGPRGYGTGRQVTDHSYPVTVSVRERLIYEREGGGAPSERCGGHPASILQKLWRRMGGEREISSR